MPLHFLIGGVDYSAKYETKSLRITGRAGSDRSSFSFRLLNPAVPPQEEQPVYIWDSAALRRKECAGRVKRVRRKPITKQGGHAIFLYTIEVETWAKDLESMPPMTTDYAAKTTGFIARDAIAHAEGFNGSAITLGGIEQDTFNVRHSTIDQILDRVAAIEGWKWWVDDDKNVYFGDPFDSDPVLTIDDDNWDYISRDTLTVEPDTSKLANQIRLFFEGKYSDGTANVFNASNEITGVGTAWKTRVTPGAKFRLKDVYDISYTIQEVRADGTIILTSNYNESTLAGQEYVIEGIPLGIQRQNTTSVALIAALSGDNGIRHKNVDYQGSYMTYKEAANYLDALLDEHSNPAINISLSTNSRLLSGINLTAGQPVRFLLTDWGIDTTLQITEVTKADVGGYDDDGYPVYEMTLKFQVRLYDLSSELRKKDKKAEQTSPRESNLLDEIFLAVESAIAVENVSGIIVPLSATETATASDDTDPETAITETPGWAPFEWAPSVKTFDTSAWPGGVLERAVLAVKFLDGTIPTYSVSGNVTIVSDEITKTGGAAATWDAEAFSNDSLPGDGYVEFKPHASAGNNRFMVGLNNARTTASYTDIDYALYCNSNGALAVYEASVYKGTFGTYAADDVLRVSREGSTVKYYKNGVVFYTSATAASGTYYMDCSIYDSGTKIKGIRIGNLTQNALVTVATPTIVRQSQAWLPDTVEQITSGNGRFPTAPSGSVGLLIEGSESNWATRFDPAAGQFFALAAGVSVVSGAAFGLQNIANAAYFPDNAAMYYALPGDTVVMVNTQIWVYSAYVIMDDGSAPIVGAAANPAADLAVVIQNQVVTDVGVEHIAGNVYRVWGRRTVNGDHSSNGIYKYTGQSSKAFKVSGHQFEQNTHMTSPMVTVNTGAISRNADTVEGPVSALNAAEGTILVQFTPLFVGGTGTLNKTLFETNTGNDRLLARIQSNGHLYFYAGKGSSLPSLDLGSPVQDSVNEAAFRWDATRFSGILNAGAPQVDSTYVNALVISKFNLGHQAGISPLYGYIHKFAIYDTYLTDGEVATEHANGYTGAVYLNDFTSGTMNPTTEATWTAPWDVQWSPNSPKTRTLTATTPGTSDAIDEYQTTDDRDSGGAWQAPIATVADKKWIKPRVRLVSNSSGVPSVELLSYTPNKSHLRWDRSTWMGSKHTFDTQAEWQTGTLERVTATAGGSVEITSTLMPNMTRTTVAYRPDTFAQVANNVPRIPAIDGTVGLLVEAGTTNLVLASQELNDAYWVKLNATVSANAITAPDSTLSADKIVDNATNGQHRFSRNTVLTVGQPATVTIFAKAGELDWIWINIDGSNTAWFNVNTGVVGTKNAGITYSRVDREASWPAGWYRCVVNHSSLGAGGNVIIGVSNADNVTSYAGAGGGVYMWGLQAELTRYPTTYMATSSATVTRNAENCSVPSDGILNKSEGRVALRFYVDAYHNGSTLASAVHRPFAWYSGHGVGLYHLDGVWRAWIVTSTGQYNADYTGTLSIGWHTAVIRWTATSVYMWIDGVLMATKLTVTGAITSASTLYVGCYNSTNQYNQPITWLATYLTGGSDAECLALSATTAAPTDAIYLLDFTDGSLAPDVIGYWTSPWLQTYSRLVNKTITLTTVTPGGTSISTEGQSNVDDSGIGAGGWKSDYRDPLEHNWYQYRAKLVGRPDNTPELQKLEISPK